MQELFSFICWLSYRDSQGDISLDELRSAMLSDLSEKELSSAVEVYRHAYGDTISEAEAFEEMCCDALGKINIFAGTEHDSANYGKVQESFRKHTAETANKGRAPPKSGVNGKKHSSEPLKYDYSKPFAEQVDDWIAGKIPKYDTLVIGATPTAFRKVGFNSLPMTINQSHVDYAINGTKNSEHHIGEALLKQLPSALEQPVAIIASETQKGTSVITLLPFTKDGKTVVAPVYIDGFGIQNTVKIDSNAVTSIYGRKNAVSNLLTKALNDHKSTEPHVFYLDKAKATALYQGSKVTVPKMPNTSDGFVSSIRDVNSPVKLKIKDVTESRQFKRWFGNSKVTNSDGTPKIVYHGTGSDFNTFDKSRQGENYVQGEGGFFFTSSRKSAESYAKLAGEDGKGRVVEAYLSIQKPYEVTAYGDYVQAPAEKYDDHRSEYLNEAEMQGCDGIIIKGEKSNLYVVFEPNQIKSATDNIGTFDESNSDIRYSREPESITELRRQNETMLAQATNEDAANENERGLIKDYKRQYDKVSGIAEKLDAARQEVLTAENSGDRNTMAIKKHRTNCPVFGRGRRLRTLGLRFWRPPLYQLSYSPIKLVGLQGLEPQTDRL